MNNITTKRSLELAEGIYRRGTKMEWIMIDGWSRGFRKSQTRHECIQMGYPLCLVEKELDRVWKRLDDQYEKFEGILKGETV